MRAQRQNLKMVPTIKRYLTRKLPITPTGTFHCSPPLLLPHPSRMKAALSCLSVARYRLISHLVQQRNFTKKAPRPSKKSALMIGLSKPNLGRSHSSKNPLTNHSLACRCQLAGHFLEFGTISLWLALLWSQHKRSTGTKGRASPPPLLLPPPPPLYFGSIS